MVVGDYLSWLSYGLIRGQQQACEIVVVCLNFRDAAV